MIRVRSQLIPLFVPLAVPLAVLLTACSSSTTASTGLAAQSAQQILAATRAAVAGVQTCSLNGTINLNGRTLSFNFQINDSQGAKGSFNLGGGASAQLIRTGNTLYINGNRQLYSSVGGREGTVAGSLLNGRWLKTTSNDPNFQSVGSLTDCKQLFSQLNSTTAIPVKSGTTTVNGQQAVGLTGTSSSSQGTLYIATNEPAYPLEITGGSGSNGGTVYFTNYNQPVNVQPPPTNETVDISEFAGT